MEYLERKVERVFWLKFSDGDPILESVEKFAHEKGIHVGLVIFLGGFSKAQLVLGLRKYSKAPGDLDRTSFSETHEVLGVGSILWADGKPKVHFHAGVAKEREVFIAHIEEANVVGAEAFILEFGEDGRGALV